MNTKGKGRLTLFFVFKTEVVFYTIRGKKKKRQKDLALAYSEILSKQA